MFSSKTPMRHHTPRNRFLTEDDSDDTGTNIKTNAPLLERGIAVRVTVLRDHSYFPRRPSWATGRRESPIHTSIPLLTFSAYLDDNQLFVMDNGQFVPLPLNKGTKVSIETTPEHLPAKRPQQPAETAIMGYNGNIDRHDPRIALDPYDFS